MIKIKIIFNAIEYVGTVERDDMNELKDEILNIAARKGYYMLRTSNGIDMMFPLNALMESEITLSTPRK